MAKNTNLALAGGICALSAGVVQMLLGFFALMLEEGLRAFNPTGLHGLAMLIMAYVPIAVGSLLIAGARTIVAGIVLIIGAVVSVIVVGVAVVFFALPCLVGGVLAVIGTLGDGGGGFRGVVAAAQRIAKAAQEPGLGAANDNEKKG